MRAQGKLRRILKDLRVTGVRLKGKVFHQNCRKNPAKKVASKVRTARTSMKGTQLLKAVEKVPKKAEKDIGNPVSRSDFIKAWLGVRRFRETAYFGIFSYLILSHFKDENKKL